MNDLAMVWHFTRVRLGGIYGDLSDSQLQWRPYPHGHSILEYLYHIAGAEFYWASRLTGRPPQNSFEQKLDRAVIDNFLAEGPFPFATEEMSKEGATQALDLTFGLIRLVFESPTDKQLSMALVSPIGDRVTGREGLVRLAQHAAYHTGQIWVLREHPECR